MVSAACIPGRSWATRIWTRFWRILAGNRCLALTQQALKSCAADLLAPMAIPRSHFLLPPGEMGETSEIEVPPGFDTVKLKCAGSDADLERIRTLGPNFRLRLDFNGCLAPEKFAAFWRKLGDSAQRVEFVEDPCPFHAPTWKNLAAETGCALALDRGSAVSAIPAGAHRQTCGANAKTSPHPGKKSSSPATWIIPLASFSPRFAPPPARALTTSKPAAWSPITSSMTPTRSSPSWGRRSRFCASRQISPPCSTTCHGNG